MKLITVTKNETDFELIVIERPSTATSIKLTQKEINELARKCDKHRTDKIHSYSIPYIGDEKLNL